METRMELHKNMNHKDLCICRRPGEQGTHGVLTWLAVKEEDLISYTIHSIQIINYPSSLHTKGIIVR